MNLSREAASATIMVVDDTPANLRLLEHMLQNLGLRVLAFPSGRMALNAARRNIPNLILLDITMPEMDGFEVCRQLKLDAALRDIPVLFISALTDVADKIKGFEVGGVDYVTKPFQFEELQARVGTHLRLALLQEELESHNHQLAEKVGEQVREIADSRQATIFALAKLTESRDDTTGGHIERTQVWCSLLVDAMLAHGSHADEMDAPFVESVLQAAPLHDIGKVGIPDTILLKQGHLTAEERLVMSAHTEIGARTLEEVHRQHPGNAFIREGIHIARSHHERWDGSGYPQGLMAEAIPLAARIMAVADTYDAMRSRRPYKEPFSHKQCVETIRAGSGKLFDPKVVEAFLAAEVRFAEESRRHGLEDGKEGGEEGARP